MLRAAGLCLLLALAACGGAAPAPATAAPSGPMRLPRHDTLATEPIPDPPAETVVAVSSPGAGPAADPPPVEAPAPSSP